MLLATASVATARQLTYVSQQRSVSAWALGINQSATAPDFGPFNTDVSAETYSDISHHYYYGRATQTSALDPSRIAMGGLVTGTSNSGNGGGDSALTVSFDVAEPVPFRVTGSGSSYPSRSSSIRLFSDSLSLVDWQPPPGTYFPVSADFSGVLTPGRYTFAAEFNASGYFSDTSANGFGFTAQLDLPEPTSVAAVVAGALILVVVTRSQRKSR